ncbi:MAG TPA: hypothetical protein VNN73_21375 [Blastocatellia bacterium]|nr:hypothetical protein [Blastocatellia bacterium]
MKRFTRFSRLGIIPSVVLVLVLAPSLFADGGANHQVRNTHFGVSGGNINDVSKAFCCSGTLGSLVTDGATQYILSNNHVLGRSDAATAGEDISQPGLIDNGCRVPPIVADFTTAVPLGQNVDAAIAQLRAGQMDSTGFIEDIGTISSVVKAPSVGLAVAKSGRTTGFTTGTIGSINTSVSVQYQRGCGSGKKFTVSYTNQVVINSSTFSAGGDSGSLIVSNNSQTCRQPVALLFAGSSTTTIGNPIGEVLSKLGGRLGRSVSFVGGNCTASAGTAVSDSGPSKAAIDFATAAMRSREKDLMSRPGVIGVGVGASDQNATDASIVVYVDATAGVNPRLPRRINGVRVKRVYTEPFVAY